MTANPEEVLNIYVMGQLRIINSILVISEKYISFDKDLNKNVFDGVGFKREIKEMGDKLKANYFPPYLP
jgi:hypothetical protein